MRIRQDGGVGERWGTETMSDRKKAEPSDDGVAEEEIVWGENPRPSKYIEMNVNDSPILVNLWEIDFSYGGAKWGVACREYLEQRRR